MFAVPCVFGLIPCISQRWNMPHKTKHLLTAFSSGILLGTAFFGLFPESIHVLVDTKFVNSEYMGFFVTLMVSAMSFVTLLFLEKSFEFYHQAINFINKKNNSHKDDLIGVPVVKKTSLYVLMFSLSVHSLIEGLALGIESSGDQKTFYSLYVAILSHKGFASFALGLSIVKKAVTFRLGFFLVLLFCFMTPVGMFFGGSLEKLFIGSLGKSVNAFLISISIGTFSYIALLDFIKKTDDKKRSLFSLLFVLVFGLFLMFIIQSDHDH